MGLHYSSELLRSTERETATVTDAFVASKEEQNQS